MKYCNWHYDLALKQGDSSVYLYPILRTNIFPSYILYHNHNSHSNLFSFLVLWNSKLKKCFLWNYVQYLFPDHISMVFCKIFVLSNKTKRKWFLYLNVWHLSRWDSQDRESCITWQTRKGGYYYLLVYHTILKIIILKGITWNWNACLMSNQAVNTKWNTPVHCLLLN